MVATAPGWYPDGQGGMRWWDGAKWTPHVAPEGDVPPTQPPVAEAPVIFAPPVAIVPPPAVAVAVAGPPPDDPAPPATPAERRQSPAWFVWAVVGAVVLLVIIVAVLVPIIRGVFATGGSVDEVPVPPAAEQREEQAVDVDPPSGADEEAAVTAVERYNEAWLTADCELYLATTTEAMREFQELPDCEAFTQAAADYGGSVDGFETTVRDVETFGDMIAVSVTQSYTSRWDAEGFETPDPVRYDDRGEYLVLNVNGEWVVDSAFPE